jgi:hypothetical protein
MATKFRPISRQADVPVEQWRPLMPSGLPDSRMFPGWGPRV